MMQHMFAMEMLICQFKFIDFFLPSQMTKCSHKYWEQLCRVFLWENPARLLGFPLMSLLMNLNNTSLLFLCFP